MLGNVFQRSLSPATSSGSFWRMLGHSQVRRDTVFSSSNMLWVFEGFLKSTNTSSVEEEELKDLREVLSISVAEVKTGQAGKRIFSGKEPCVDEIETEML